MEPSRGSISKTMEGMRVPNAANSSSKMKTEVIGNLDKSHFQEGFRKEPDKTGLRVIRRKEIRDRESDIAFEDFVAAGAKNGVAAGGEMD